jgi:hypothetical protein
MRPAAAAETSSEPSDSQGRPDDTEEDACSRGRTMSAPSVPDALRTSAALRDTALNCCSRRRRRESGVDAATAGGPGNNNRNWTSQRCSTGLRRQRRRPDMEPASRRGPPEQRHRLERSPNWRSGRTSCSNAQARRPAVSKRNGCQLESSRENNGTSAWKPKNWRGGCRSSSRTEPISP